MRFTAICEETVREVVARTSRRLDVRHNVWGAVHVILHCCNWKPGWKDGVYLERGELVYGQEEFGEHCYLSYRQVRTALFHLERVGFLTTKPTTQGTVATVIDFDTYVIPPPESDGRTDAQHKEIACLGAVAHQY